MRAGWALHNRDISVQKYPNSVCPLNIRIKMVPLRPYYCEYVTQVGKGSSEGKKVQQIPTSQFVMGMFK